MTSSQNLHWIASSPSREMPYSQILSAKSLDISISESSFPEKEPLGLGLEATEVCFELIFRVRVSKREKNQWRN
jgi:hypothetical protein